MSSLSAGQALEGGKKLGPESIKEQEHLSYKERLKAGTVQPGREKTQ